jgi:hypothetical protein
MKQYHAFADSERVSAFAAWLLTLSAAMWSPVGRELTHHRERRMEYLRDSRSFDAYQNHQKIKMFSTGLTHGADGAPYSFRCRNVFHGFCDDWQRATDQFKKNQ